MDDQIVINRPSKNYFSSALPYLLVVVAIGTVYGVGYLIHFGVASYMQTGALNSALPSFDENKNISVLGVELYKNIDKKKYGDEDYIKAAKGELVVRLKDEVDESKITMIAYENKMEILERYKADSPLFRLRLSKLNDETAKGSSALAQAFSSSDIENIFMYGSYLSKSDGTLEDIWKKLDSNSKIGSVNLNTNI